MKRIIIPAKNKEINEEKMNLRNNFNDYHNKRIKSKRKKKTAKQMQREFEKRMFRGFNTVK